MGYAIFQEIDDYKFITWTFLISKYEKKTSLYAIFQEIDDYKFITWTLLISKYEKKTSLS